MRRPTATLLLSLALFACSGGGSPPPDEFRGLRACHPKGLLSVGEALPDCSFKTFDGATFRLAELKGKPSVLNFWASWCPNCIREMPDFDAVAAENASKLRLLGFDLERVDGETEKAAREFAKERGVRYTLLFDPKGLFYAHFAGAPRLPTTIFVNAAGRVVHRQFGELNADALRALIDKHLI